MGFRKILLPAFLILIFCLFTSPLSADGDFYHHLSMGKFILENHFLPQTDEFTFTAKGKPQVAYSWLSGVIFNLIFQNFGAAGISFFIASIATLTFFLLYLLLSSFSLPKSIIYLSMFLAIGPIATRFPSRPEVWTYPLLLSLLLINKSVFLYPLLILLWANLYGSSVILGLLILILLAFKKQNLSFFLSLLASFFASLINGYGFGTIFYAHFIPQVAKTEGEWAGMFETFAKAPENILSVFRYSALIYFLYLFLFLLILAFSWKIIKNHLFYFLLALAIFIPLIAVRQIPLATILSIPLIAILLRNQHKLLLILALIVTFISISISVYVNPIRPGSENPNKLQLIEYMKSHNLSGRVLNDQQLGGFLTYYLYPKVLVSYDTRDEVFIHTSIPKDMTRLPPDLLVSKYRADFLIVNYKEDEKRYKNFFASTNWVPIFMNDSYLIAAPKKSF